MRREFESAENKLRILDGSVDLRVQQLAARACRRGGERCPGEKGHPWTFPAFQVDGKFNYDRYRLALASQIPPQNEQQFERLVRQGLEESLVNSAIGESNFSPRQKPTACSS